jgi:dihydrofolate reductase
MKKIFMQMLISLDGYVEGPNQELDWHLVDGDLNAFAVDMLENTDVLIMGRKTYELMAGYWPTATGNDPVVKEQMNRTPKLVFSRTLTTVAWENSRLASGPIVEEVARLRNGPGEGQLCVGGSSLAASFLELGLIDELRIIVTPMLLGGGLTLLDGIKKRHPLKLLSTKTFRAGNVVLIYQPVYSGS